MARSSMGPSRTVGIVAGGGALPGEVAASVVARGGRVFLVLIEGTFDEALTSFPHTVVNWAQLSRATAAFEAAGVRDVVFLGKYARPSFRNARPDFGFVRALPAVLRLLSAGGDDAVLRGLVALFERRGFKVVGVGDVVGELVVGAGALTSARPAATDDDDIARGFALIAALGRHDIGQAAVVSDGVIEAIEGAEGTDAMLLRVADERRALGLHQSSRGVLVKRPKPGQDLRVDLPAIGPDTVLNANAAGLAGIAVMSGHVLAAERSRLIDRANERGLFVVGVNDTTASSLAPVRRAPTTVVLGAVVPTAAHRQTINRAAGIAAELAEHATGSALVVRDKRVFAIGAAEPSRAVIARASGLMSPRRSKSGVAVIGAQQRLDADLVQAAANANLSAVVRIIDGSPALGDSAAIKAANSVGLILADAVLGAPSILASKDGSDALKIFVVAGEHSGDALGGKLMTALRASTSRHIAFAGVGGDDMTKAGLASLFPIEDVAVMGPLSILPRLPRLIRRVYQTVDAAVLFKPDIVVIIDSPEFTHPIAKRIRHRAPNIPIVDYVSPSVWAWRPGRATRMRAYVDHVLALLPFEPEAHNRLGGPSCSYVGHPLIEQLDAIRSADTAELARRLNIADGKPVLVVLPGSRTSEIERLIGDFGTTLELLAASGPAFHAVIPAVRHVRRKIEAAVAAWPVKPHIVDGAVDKYAAMRLARAALAASGTVTLELALAGTPMVVAYKADAVTAAVVRRLIKTDTAVLANLVLGDNAFPEFIQQDCTPEKLSRAVAELLHDSVGRNRQLAALQRIPDKVALADGTPSAAAAAVVLRVLADHAAGKSRRAGPTYN